MGNLGSANGLGRVAVLAALALLEDKNRQPFLMASYWYDMRNVLLLVIRIYLWLRLWSTGNFIPHYTALCAEKLKCQQI